MPWTPPAPSVYDWKDDPDHTTPLDQAHLETAATVDQNFAITAIQSAIPFLQQMESNTQVGASYTFVLADAGLAVVGNRATAQAFTVPPHSSVALPVNAILVVVQYGAGRITWTAGAGVTLSSDGARVTTTGQYALSSAWQYVQNQWILSGDLS